MSYGMYLSAEGAKAQSQRLEVVSNNMANINTVGFKPDVAIFQARYAEAIQQGDARPGMKGLADIGGGVKTIETRTSFAAGKLQSTGNDGDVAILGEGFFAVQPDEGERPLLTRAGSFRVDQLNRLVMADSGRPVLSAGGGPILLDPTQQYSITADGYVQQEGQLIPMALIKPASTDHLDKIGGNLFKSREEVFPVPAAQREVAQGFLEMSGANSTQQMLQLIETNRAFEANTQMIRHQDTATGSLIGRLLVG